MADNRIGNRQDFYPKDTDTLSYEDEEMQPYLALFQKPLTSRKSRFSKQDLAVMCKDPLRSPRLIHYLIDFVRNM